jgi:putative ABC transport system permease protein
MILVLGIDPSDDKIRLRGVSEHLSQLKRPDSVIIDRYSRAEFKPAIEDFQQDLIVRLQLNERTTEVIGLYDLGTSFGMDASVLTTDLNFLRIFPDRRPGNIELGLIRLAPGSAPSAVKRQIKEFLPNDVLLLTRGEFIQREVDYWNTSTPIGYIFTLGAVIGTIVGLIIVYQILFSDVQSHLAEYATLKAMGYTGGFLRGLVIRESFYLSVLGFLPALGLSIVLYDQAAQATQLPMEMTAERGVVVFVVTVLMCAFSGMLAIRKLDKIDPAEVF